MIRVLPWSIPTYSANKEKENVKYVENCRETCLILQTLFRSRFNGEAFDARDIIVHKCVHRHT